MLRDGEATTVDYDAVGRTAEVAGPLGRVVEHQPFGRTTSVARGTSAPATFEYDPRGRLAGFADPAGVATSYSINERDEVVGHRTGDASLSFAYSPTGWLASVTDPYGQLTGVTHDAVGNLTSMTRPDGPGIRYEYGPDGLPSGELGLDGSRLVALTRDRNGAIVAATAGELAARVERDALGRVTEVRADAGTVRYAWDADGYLTGLTDDDGFGFAIESQNGSDPSTLVLSDGTRVDVPGDLDLERDEAGRVTSDERGRSYRYALAGRLAETVVDGTATTYDYDDLGPLAAEHTDDGTRRYRYGRAGELVERVDEHGGSTTFTHDVAGRRTEERHPDGSTVTYSWDDRDRMTRVRRIDADGTETDHRIRYDAFGRPAFVDETPILWDLGATGRLLGIGAERYLWHGSRVLTVDTAADGAPAIGTWSRRVSDDPWGVDGGSGVRLGYRGELAVDDLLILHDRVYDTRTRSFLSRDPEPSRPGEVSSPVFTATPPTTRSTSSTPTAASPSRTRSSPSTSRTARRASSTTSTGRRSASSSPAPWRSALRRRSRPASAPPSWPVPSSVPRPVLRTRRSTARPAGTWSRPA